MINLTVTYVLWLREMKRFFRTKSRVFGTMAMPLLFLIFLGFGFGRMNVPGVSKNIDYINFLVPGIIGMSLLFTSTFAGLSVLWDREFGFLKEIMVAPVSRVSIAVGRIAGGISTSLLQGISILLVSLKTVLTRSIKLIRSETLGIPLPVLSYPQSILPIHQ